MTSSTEVTSEEALQRELCALFESAHRNSVLIGSISTWVCRHNTSLTRNSGLPNSRRTDHAFGSCPQEADRYETGGRLIGLTLSTELARHYMCVPSGWENTSGTNTALGSRIALGNAVSESRPHQGDSANDPSRCDRWTSEPCFPRGSDRLGFTGMYTCCARRSVIPASVLLP